MNVKTTRLSRISETIRRGVAPDYADSGHAKIINQSCVYQSEIILDKVKYQNDSVLLPDKARILEFDILINSTGTGTLGRVGFVSFAPENLFADGHVSILRISDVEVIQKFVFYHLFNMQDYFENALAKGATNQTELSPKSIGDIEISIPPLPEQRAIVAFLDAKLAQIDKFIANKRRLIELLLEQKQVIVNRYVTRGLDDSVELKDSGLEWLGQVPKHWEVKRAKYFFYEVDERSKSGTEEMLSVSHITGVTPRSEKNVTMFMSETNVGQKICQPNDVVINILWAWMGALGVSRHHGIVSPAYGVYRQRDDLFEFGYLDGLLRHKGYVGEYGVRSKGVTSSRARMYSEDFFDIPFPRPPLSEQRAIVARIEQETSAIARAVAQAEREIELIQEYRTTLISDAVTGKIDVREWGGTEPEYAE